MTMKFSKSVFTSAALCGALLAMTEAAQAVDIVKMRQNMVNDLEGHVNAYALFVVKGNATQAWKSGWAVRSVDSLGGKGMTLGTRSFIASVTKTFSAVATLQLLEANNLTVSEKIANWLPADWAKGPGINQLTFKDLMQHKTGFKEILDTEAPAGWNNDWDGLKWLVAKGAKPGAPHAYKNANFALLRVIIPKLWKASGDPAAAFASVTANNHGIHYMDYVTKHIFEPSGIDPGASCTASELYQRQAYGYTSLNPTQPGTLSETSAANCGGHAGLRMSARDLARFMISLQNGTILSPGARLAMDVYKLGWDDDSNTNVNGRLGKWWHGGQWSTGYEACVMKYPGDVVATLVTNSINESKNPCTVLKDAYNNAD